MWNRWWIMLYGRWNKGSCKKNCCILKNDLLPFESLKTAIKFVIRKDGVIHQDFFTVIKSIITVKLFFWIINCKLSWNLYKNRREVINKTCRKPTSLLFSIFHQVIETEMHYLRRSWRNHQSACCWRLSCHINETECRERHQTDRKLETIGSDWWGWWTN